MSKKKMIISWHKTHKKQYDNITYHGAGFVQVTVSCSLQQHEDAKSLEKSIQIPKIKIFA